MLEVKDLSKSFIQGNSQPIQVLDQINFSVEAGQWVSVTGPSGSGKSTLLSIMAGLELPSSGDVLVGGESVCQLGEEERARFRAENFSFVFQSFRLMPTMTAVENVMLPLELLGEPDGRSRALEILDRVGLAARAKHLPSELSGGEQQRVAVARAFVNRPKVMFADEPTGNLDAESSEKVLRVLRELNSEAKTSLIVVTHDMSVAEIGDQKLALKQGKIS